MGRVLLETPGTVGVTHYAATAMGERRLVELLEATLDAAGEHVAGWVADRLGVDEVYVVTHLYPTDTASIPQPHVHLAVPDTVPHHTLADTAVRAHTEFQHQMMVLCDRAELTVRQTTASPHGWELGPVEHTQHSPTRTACRSTQPREHAPLLRLNPPLADAS